MAETNEADWLTNTEQVIPVWLVEISVSGRAKIIVKPWFGDMELNISDSTWGLFACFQQTIIYLAHDFVGW